MRLAAIATAAGVPDGGFAGTVEHVYPRVCLLGLADQTLVTLATSAVGHLPRGITLDWSAEFPSHVAPGCEATRRCGQISNCGAGRPLQSAASPVSA